MVNYYFLYNKKINKRELHIPMLAKKSPLAPKSFPKLPKIKGISMFSIHGGIRKSKKEDLILVSMEKGTTASCTLTNSKMPSAPVIWCRKIRNKGKARALVVNSGNANAHTGLEGVKTVLNTVNTVSDVIKCKNSEVYIASTGVIGEKLPSELITDSIPKLYASKQSSWESIASAICTTDTFAKGATSSCIIEGKKINIVGIAKGSGMIFPNMGTMLAFIFTDIKIPAKILSSLLKEGVEKSFNSITVDGDTSTSDTCGLFATGIIGLQKPILKMKDTRVVSFGLALNNVLQNLAKQIVCDGEGAKKLITINVEGAKTEKVARKIGMSVANSALVKTAVAGEDANWGRVVMAIGKAGISILPSLLSISIGNIVVSELGSISRKHSESRLSRYMKNKEITININLAQGDCSAKVWTCDLTHDYIRINADYRS